MLWCTDILYRVHASSLCVSYSIADAAEWRAGSQLWQSTLGHVSVVPDCGCSDATMLFALVHSFSVLGVHVAACRTAVPEKRVLLIEPVLCF